MSTQPQQDTATVNPATGAVIARCAIDGAARIGALVSQADRGLLEMGAVFINGHAASDLRTPVGGVKKSGYGRGLSHFGLREFVNAQTVWAKA